MCRADNLNKYTYWIFLCYFHVLIVVLINNITSGSLTWIVCLLINNVANMFLQNVAILMEQGAIVQIKKKYAP
jgi:hypothetical protein